MTQQAPERIWAWGHIGSRRRGSWTTTDVGYAESQYTRTDLAQAQLDAKNARIARLEAALREIANDPYKFGQRVQAFKAKARAALEADT